MDHLLCRRRDGNQPAGGSESESVCRRRLVVVSLAPAVVARLGRAILNGPGTPGSGLADTGVAPLLPSDSIRRSLASFKLFVTAAGPGADTATCHGAVTVTAGPGPPWTDHMIVWPFLCWPGLG